MLIASVNGAAPPSNAELARLARLRPELAFPIDGPLALARNAHYANTRRQLAFALQHPYNSIEGDVRVRDGVAVMSHDAEGSWDLTFDEWAAAVATSGRMARIDLKEAAAAPLVSATLRRLDAAGSRITFNATALVPGLASNMSIEGLRTLRAQHPGSWLTLNTPAPVAGWLLVAAAARRIGGDRIGIALQAPLVTRSVVRSLQAAGLTVNVWNHPPLWAPRDTAAYEQYLRRIGVDGMIDLRRPDDPLARP